MHIIILDEIDGRIVVRHSGGADSGNSKFVALKFIFIYLVIA